MSSFAAPPRTPHGRSEVGAETVDIPLRVMTTARRWPAAKGLDEAAAPRPGAGYTPRRACRDDRAAIIR